MCVCGGEVGQREGVATVRWLGSRLLSGMHRLRRARICNFCASGDMHFLVPWLLVSVWRSLWWACICSFSAYGYAYGDMQFLAPSLSVGWVLISFHSWLSTHSDVATPPFSNEGSLATLGLEINRDLSREGGALVVRCLCACIT